jgi:hypothetical protein
VHSSSEETIGERVREKDGNEGRPQRHRYNVHRWRLADHPSRPSATVSPGARRHADSPYPPDEENNIRMRHAKAPWSSNREPFASSGRNNGPLHCLSADHILINLITQNVGRGLNLNKTVLHLGASFTKVISNVPLSSDRLTPCDIAVVRPTRQKMPPCLQPTQLQMNLPHPAWIDAIPFPDMRDILILQQNNFNHVHFLEDLIGEMAHWVPPVLARQLGRATLADNQSHVPQHDSHIAPSSKGLILWGEPHLKENWEATPLFLKKWTWAVEGCAELVSYSNMWRYARGEEPLDLSNG